MNFFFAIWILMALGVAGLIVYRRHIASQEDDVLHLGASSGAVAQQTTVAQKLDQVDKWGKTLTIVAVAYGFVLVAIYFYRFWVSSSTTGI
ncbi:MAG: hypothetical protein ABSH56_29685 [Bryobacteraceae bacterium]|jgi:hypothetical protein